MSKELHQIIEVKLVAGVNGRDLRLLCGRGVFSDLEYRKVVDKTFQVKDLSQQHQDALMHIWKLMKDALELSEGVASPDVNIDETQFLRPL